MGARRLVLGAIVVAATLLPAGPAPAAVGADNSSDAPPLLFSVPGTVADNEAYTVEGGEPVGAVAGCNSTAMTRTAWWRFTGTGQPITLTTLASSFDTVLAVYDAPTGVPILGNRVACNDDDPGTAGGTTSALTFASTRGKNYLVQVGSLGPDHGRIDVRASSARPANDDVIAAQALQTGVVTTVSNAGASQELGEALTCATATYAATIWFAWTAPAVGDAVFSSFAAFGDTVLTVYRDGAVQGCNTGSTALVPLRVSPGTYLVQVGTKGSNVEGLGVGAISTRADFALDPDVDNDGEFASTDCNDANPAIRHGVVDTPDDGVDQNCDGVDAVNLDRDGDGEARPGDCRDDNPAINHRARDIPGNAVDEDCTDGPAPFPRLASTVRTSWSFAPFRLTKLVVQDAVAGSKVVLRCKGRGCPFKRKVVKVRRARAELSVLSNKLKKARLKRGAVLEVRITMPAHVGFMRRHTVRGASQDPKIIERCLPAGGGRPQRC
jgi:hypothetical protein